MGNLNFGVIGNCKTAAMISESGAIEWCCLPNFDSSSVFAHLLDDEIGGRFQIIVNEAYKIKQYYVKNTNILSTRFQDGSNIFEIIDFMPRYKIGEREYYNPPDIIRYFKHISGNPKFSILYNPALEYAKHNTETVIMDEYVKSYTTDGEYDSLYLYSDIDFQKIIESEEIQLLDDAFVLITYNQKLKEQNLDLQYLQLHKTKSYWLNWAYNVTSYDKYQNEIIRSALVLKMLSYDKSGAVLAAITTSIPETIGEERNWDYRFCWIRDASMVVRVMLKLGHFNTVQRFVNFIIDIIPDKDEKIQIMYGINREKALDEKVLDYLKGYKNSTPVRIGNAAFNQKQHDIFGVLMDVIYQQFSVLNTSLENSEYLWTIVRSIIKTVKSNWQKPDKGIWEIRNDEKHFTFSKVLCWVAIDRGIKIAKIISKYQYIDLWQQLADEIKKEVYQKAWNSETNSFTQCYGSNDQDAANLLMESYGFISAKDEKYIQTVKAVKKELCVDGLMFRYKNKDDFGYPKSSFTICTFWLINALDSIGERKEAKKIFDKLLTFSNHLGLFSEDIDFESKRLLGNFPQAYSHLALIETAINLSKGDLTEDEKLMKSIHS